MFIKRALSILLAMALLVTAVSCTSSTPSGSDGNNSNSGLKSGNSKELSMYVMDYDTTTQKAIEKFNETHKEVQIKAKSLVPFPADNLRSRLMYEFNNGEGPDIILCENDTLPNLSVFFGKGSFYDLNTLISNDKSFKQSEFFEKVIDYGVYKEKRYIMPLSFKIDAMFTTQDILVKSGVEIDGKNIGLDAFTEAADKYMGTTNGQGKYFVSALDFCNIAQTSATPFFDLENKTATFESKEFIDLLNIYKSVAGSVCPSSMTAKRTDANNILSESKAVFLNFGTMGPRYASEPYRSFESEIDPVIIPSPSGDKSTHVIAKPEKYIGISSKCGNVKAAFEFVKLMMSEQYQDIDIMEGIPVNREAYEQAKESCLKKMKGYDAWQAGGCKKESTLKKIYSQLDSLIEKVDRFTTTDIYVNAIIKDKLAGFMDGGTSAEDTAKGIQQEIQNYLKNGIMNPAWETRQSELNKPRTGKEIKVYYVFFQEYIKNAIEEYKKKYQSEDIVAELQNDYTEMMKKTETELMAGVGPGLVLFDKYFFNSIRKVVSTGALYPLDDMIKADSSHKAEDYYQNILDAGVYDGKRYFYPVYYEYSPFETTKEALERNNIKIDYSKWTWSQLHDIAMKFSKEHKGGYLFDMSFSFNRMVKHSGLKLVDYKNKTCNFNSPEFKELIRFYKDFVPLKLPEEKGESQVNMLKHRTCVLTASYGIANPVNLYCEFDRLQVEVNENLVVVPNPSYSGDKHVYIRTDDCIGINSKCKNKDVAYNYIKILMSEGIQSGVRPDGYAVAGTGAPVSKKGYKISFDNWLHSFLNKIPKDTLYFIDNNADKLENPEIDDDAIIKIIEESVNSYVDGKRTLDEAVKEIDDKVSIFLNE